VGVRDGSGPSSEVPAWDARLAQALGAALGRTASDGPRSLLFSGGVDSGLLAWELRADPYLTLSTIGVEGSTDPVDAASAAQEIGLPWSSRTVTPDEVASVARRAEVETRGLGPTARAVQVAFALAVESAPRGIVLCGQGADELFFGYAHYRELSVEEAGRRADADLRDLQADAWPRARRLARAVGRQVEAPYLDTRFVEAAREIPLEDRVRGPPPKSAFRAFAQRRGLPDSIALRPKKALQYGSGIDRLLRRGTPPVHRVI
jgi:asparagine synthase (glutamine-hydrolysing)